MQGALDETDRIIYPHGLKVNYQVIKLGVPVIDPIEMIAPAVALLIILLDEGPGLFRGDALTLHLFRHPVFDVGQNPHLEDMANALNEEMTGQSVINHVILDELVQERLAYIGDIALLAIGEALKN